MSPVRATRVPVMIRVLYRPWAVAVVCVAVAAESGRMVPESGEELEYEERLQPPGVNYRNVRDDSGYSPGLHDPERVARPVSYTYFSANVRDGRNPQIDLPPHQIYGPQFDVRPATEVQQVVPPPSLAPPILTDNVRQQSHLAPYQEEGTTFPPVSRRTVRFPLNTVLPANSLSFDHAPYPGLLQAVNTFSDLSPSRKPNEGVLVTHNTVSLPATSEGVTTASRTRITNHGAYGGGGSFPYRDFTETLHNTQGDRGRLHERTQRLRVHHALDGEPLESYAPYKTAHGDGGNRYESGESNQGDHHATKGGKGEKEYKKDHKHHKQAKGYHDKERDSSNLEENEKNEKKFHKDEEFYGEHHKTEKGGKGKKYGEGGKHKKGHTTLGEHNIIKKDEFIKKTKFYDEDHGGGEHEEHGEFYGQHEEKKGGNKEGANKETNYETSLGDKKKSHDKGHDIEEHRNHETGSAQQEHFEREEEYGGEKSGHTFKKWGNTIGDHH